MALSLKISKVHDNELELLGRIKKINSPGKKALLKALVEGDWNAVYSELLFRIELYAELKVLNYTKSDLNELVNSIKKITVPVIAAELCKKYILVEPIVVEPVKSTIPKSAIPLTNSLSKFSISQEEVANKAFGLEEEDNYIVSILNKYQGEQYDVILEKYGIGVDKYFYRACVRLGVNPDLYSNEINEDNALNLYLDLLFDKYSETTSETWNTTSSDEIVSDEIVSDEFVGNYIDSTSTFVTDVYTPKTKLDIIDFAKLGDKILTIFDERVINNPPSKMTRVEWYKNCEKLILSILRKEGQPIYKGTLLAYKSLVTTYFVDEISSFVDFSSAE